MKSWDLFHNTVVFLFPGAYIMHRNSNKNVARVYNDCLLILLFKLYRSTTVLSCVIGLPRGYFSISASPWFLIFGGKDLSCFTLGFIWMQMFQAGNFWMQMFLSSISAWNGISFPLFLWELISKALIPILYFNCKLTLKDDLKISSWIPRVILWPTDHVWI